jgi:nicotinate-nucleotide pyrophosphorylase (carboxylating)
VTRPGRSTVDRLAAAGLDPHGVLDVVRRALAEDVPAGQDVTSIATVPADRVDTADLVARTAGTVAGLPVAAAVFELVGAAAAAAGDESVHITLSIRDGESVTSGQTLATVTGPTRALLTAERTALNLLCHLSGIATLTRAWVDAVAGTGAAIRDTRKTLPGLRALEKYAVRCGGGRNHRMSLSDAGLVKDNHVAAAGGVAAAFAAIRAAYPDLAVEVECDTLADVEVALAAGADLLLLDNMSVPETAAAVELAGPYRRRPGGVRLESSGGLTLDRALAVARTGVDYLSVGALTHSAPALDIALDLRTAASEGSATGASAGPGD